MTTPSSTSLMSSMAAVAFIALVMWSEPCAAENEDFRCKCVCPSPGVVTNDTKASNRKLYIGNVGPNHCNCDYVVLPKLTQDVQDKAKEFCPRCECKYETRNTSTIRFVIVFIIGVISFLLVYMAFLMLLDPLIHKSVTTRNYEQHIDEEVSMDEQIVTDSDGVTRRRAAPPVLSPTSSGGPPPKNIMNRVGQQQTRWKKQVQEQRKNIYDKHSMLN